MSEAVATSDAAPAAPASAPGEVDLAGSAFDIDFSARGGAEAIAEAIDAPEGETAPESDVEAAADTADEPADPEKADPEKEEPEKEEAWTKERIEEERTKLDEERKTIATEREEASKALREAQQKRLEIIKKAQQLDQREQKHRARKEKDTQDWKQKQAYHEVVHANVQALRDGDVEAKLRALAWFVGAPDGKAAYEQLTLGIASNGKRPEDPPGVAELRAKLARMEEEKRQAEEKARREAQARTEQERVQQWRSAIVEAAKGSTEMPILARFATAKPDRVADEALRLAVSFHQQNGRQIDTAELFRRLDAQYRELLELSQPAQGTVATGENVTATSGVETGPETVAPANPATPQRTAKGSSIPQTLGTSGNKRAMSEAERKRAAEALLPDDWLPRGA